MTTEDEAVLFGESKTGSPEKQTRKVVSSGTASGVSTKAINPLDHSKKDPLINKLQSTRDALQNCPQLWSELAKHCGDMRALVDDHLCDEKLDLTFSEMNDVVQRSASVFANLGVEKGVNVAVLGENSARWLMVDHGIQMAGGASAVRGADAPADELRYVYEHSDSKAIVVMQGPRLFQKLLKDAKGKSLGGLGLTNKSHGPVKTVVMMHREKKTDEELAVMAVEAGVTIQVLADMIEAADPISADKTPTIGLDDVATIVYTSGTTGRPKGVMLTHGNLLHQIGHRLAPSMPYDKAEPIPGQKMVSLLPVWHITERTFELWIASRGCFVVYSTIRSFKNDMAKHKPEWMVLVPRVLEKIALGVQDKFSSGSVAVKVLSTLFTKTGGARATNKKIANGLVVGSQKPSFLKRLTARLIVTGLAPLNAVGDALVWSKVKAGFGGNLKMIIAGGSALSGSLETFYETCGMTICVGYGLTECSPLLAFRRSDENLVTAGCAGKPAADTEIRIVDADAPANDTEERKPLPDGVPGVVLGRGPQVMKGYYKNPSATRKAVDRYGFFDTGDMGLINAATGDLILTGRVKDTIVLNNGENIEPIPIEDAIIGQSSMIEQVMLTGQDGRRLVAIAVLNPKELSNAGYLTKEEGIALQKANEKVNDPKCTDDDCAASTETLKAATTKLRNDDALYKALKAESKAATKSFRAWEQVGNILVTLEPFAMANGQLTQSYKVKRASVLERYEDELPE
eukprot:CAMPEP_0194030520 /NCGR_PEP_ID=MMETSP0009_2-20130614/3971_1 /TAXON_ID=210454 /ORGANISM="Grammatophora oceanica, Strain CCMP 410" /LENGTH=741 /DNA_ID=CAMNT_0038670477 /DNA_START=288 /DNA_END=2513 /DNA_ORIENTATION=+